MGDKIQIIDDQKPVKQNYKTWNSVKILNNPLLLSIYHSFSQIYFFKLLQKNNGPILHTKQGQGRFRIKSKSTKIITSYRRP